VLLAAGAGSGKTSVLVERFVRAVLEDGVAPGRILAITFTERAAGELRERVRARLLELGAREMAREADGAFVSTFHGFCARLLRVHAMQGGVEPGFRILEEGFADRLRMLAFRDALADLLEGERAQAVDLVAAYGADPLRGMVLGAYAHLRSQGQLVPELPVGRLRRDAPGTPDLLAAELRAERRDAQIAQTLDLDARATATAVLIGELVERFGVAYEQRKRAGGALDFDDLELSAGAMLQHSSEVRALWSERFQLLMVDESQDSNPRQLQLLAALDRDNLFTVGDELQSIYGFRHADVNLFRERSDRLAARGATFALTRNFRSAPAILAAVERIFAERMGERFTALIPGREAAAGNVHQAGAERRPASGSVGCPTEHEPIVELLLTDKRGWEHLGTDEDLAGLAAATPWRQAEARLLAARVLELIAREDARAGEIVLLLRSLGDMPVYESALRRAGLPTIAGVGGFWSHQQVGDLLAWLRALANPLDELALYSTLASPLVGISSDGLALIAGLAREREYGVWRAVSDDDSAPLGVLSEPDRERLVAFRELFAAEREAMALHSIAELLRRAIAATGYERHVLSLGWGERRLANVHKLIRLARAFEAHEGRELRGFLDHVAHLEAALAGREADAPVTDDALDAVRLMSIHAAKGLEFPVVCVADLGREPNVRVPDLLVDGPSGRLGLRLVELTDPESKPALDFEELCQERQSAQLEEEDRVLYVACTRAEKRLVLSGAVAFERWPAPRPGVAPIAWVAKALVPDAPTLAESARQLAEDTAAQRCEGSTAAGASLRPLQIDTGDGLVVRCLLNTAQGGGERVCEPQAAQSPVGFSPAQVAPVAPSPGAQILSRLDTPRRPDPQREAGLATVAAWAPRDPVPLADPDGTMSYTALAELERCGYRYYLERVLHLRENRAAARAGREEDSGIEARTRGTLVHLLLESVDFPRPRAPSPQEVGVAARAIGARLSVAEQEEIAALLTAALQAEPAQMLAGAGTTRREHPFAFSLSPGEPLVTGVLDLVLEQPNGTMLVVDYKSDRLDGTEDLERLVERDYGIQRLLYALAAIEGGAREVEVAHWFLERPNRWFSVRFAAGERESLRERLLARVASGRENGFAVTTMPHRGICLTCPGRGGLCSWGETRTMRERSATLEFSG
jgi:ATP-dependent helicase/nuclease subunit A